MPTCDQVAMIVVSDENENLASLLKSLEAFFFFFNIICYEMSASLKLLLSLKEGTNQMLKCWKLGKG